MDFRHIPFSDKPIKYSIIIIIGLVEGKSRGFNRELAIQPCLAYRASTTNMQILISDILGKTCTQVIFAW